MNRWFLIDTMKTGEKTVTLLDSERPEVVRFLFKKTWQDLSAADREKRESFIAVLCETDADGKPDMNTIQTTMEIC